MIGEAHIVSLPVFGIRHGVTLLGARPGCGQVVIPARGGMLHVIFDTDLHSMVGPSALLVNNTALRIALVSKAGSPIDPHPNKLECMPVAVLHNEVQCVVPAGQGEWLVEAWINNEHANVAGIVSVQYAPRVWTWAMCVAN